MKLGAIVFWFLGGAVLLMVFWSKLKTIWPFSLLAQSAVGGAISTGAATVSKLTAEATLQSLVVQCWAASDMDSIALLATLRQRIRDWNVAVEPESVSTPVVSPSVESLQADLAALQAQVAAQAKTTSTIPAASMAGG